MLAVADLPRSTYFYHLSRQNLPDKNAGVKALIIRLFGEHKDIYGYRRIASLLRRYGYRHSGKTVLKWMKEMSLESPVRRKRFTVYHGTENGITGNLLKRNFRTDAPEEKWVTDVTEFRVKDEKYFLSAIQDLFNGEIVAWETSRRPRVSLINGMLEKALVKLSGKKRPLLHSDQGWQYQMPGYKQKLAVNGIKQSMSRRGNCLDNAVIENFFGHLKAEMFYLKKFGSVKELRVAIEEYIKFWNEKRIRMSLNGLSPAEYRAQYNDAH